MHGWVEAMTEHPEFHWARANGWAFMTEVELLEVLDTGDLPGGGSGVKAGGPHTLDLGGEIAVHEVRHEVEVENLPHGDVADAGDEGDQEAAGEGAAEGDLAGEGVVAVAADAEVDEQERCHHDGVAEGQAVSGAHLVREEQRTVHQNGDDESGDETEGEDGFLHVSSWVQVRWT